jgi:UDP-N-acetylmuramoyl-tripeptide--D-alanyl-D-alanine ligase
MASLLAAVHGVLPQAGSVLVKGSRFMKMEQVVEALAAAAQTQPHKPAQAAPAGGAQ